MIDNKSKMEYIRINIIIDKKELKRIKHRNKKWDTNGIHSNRKEQ